MDEHGYKLRGRGCLGCGRRGGWGRVMGLGPNYDTRSDLIRQDGHNGDQMMGGG
jgi:hypothetical protein